MVPSLLTFQHDHIVFDACCVTNLHSSGSLEAILRTIPAKCALPFDVNQEVDHPDIESLLGMGLLSLTDIRGDNEENLYIHYAASARSNGEAASIAIAKNRNWAIATDERKITAMLRDIVPNVQILTTPDLLKHWSDETKVSTQELVEALQAVNLKASYTPSELHPLLAWWKESARNTP